MAIGLALAVTMSGLLVADLLAHRKFDEAGGVNIWGYRGPTAGAKLDGQRRVVVLGESTAYGYGVHWRDALPAALERVLNESSAGGPPPFSIVNLAYNGEGAHSYRYNLETYAALEYDAAVLYTGYPDLAYLQNFDVSNRVVYRADSAVFRWTGYFPILPLVMKEKAMAIRYGGRLEDAYRGEPTVFRPNFAERTAASMLEAAVGVSETLDRHFAESRQSGNDERGRPVELHDPASVMCGTYTGYCGELYRAVSYLLEQGKAAVVVGQPIISPQHRQQQQVVREYLTRRFGRHPNVRVASLDGVIDLKDATATFDGMHATAAGNLALARALAPIVAALFTGAPADDTRREAGDAPEETSAHREPAITPRPAGVLHPDPPGGRPMVWVPPGRVRLGSPAGEAGRDTGEQLHWVTIRDGFWMDVREVTHAEYFRFVQTETIWSNARLSSELYDGYYLRAWRDEQPPVGREDEPVSAVPWSAAVAYCRWQGGRLPTEAEWEHAARAGTSTAYWWGDAFDAARVRGGGPDGRASDAAARTNPWGVVDILGSVAEWTVSMDAPYPYVPGDGRDGLEGEARRVVRGGGGLMPPEFLRSAERVKYSPRIASDYVGLRCVSDDRQTP